MEIKQLETKEMNLKDIKTADYNPRKQLKAGDKAYERIKNSILNFGYVDPMIYNKRTKRLVGGHQRLQIMKDLGVKKATVSVVDLDETREKELNITLNRVEGEFETEALVKVLQELDEQASDLDNLGFDTREFDDLIFAMEMDNQKSGSFLNDLVEKGEEIGDLNNTDYTGIANSDVNVNRNVDGQDLYPSYTKPDTEPVSEEYEEEDGEQYFKMTFPVTFEERDTVLEAIRKAKQQYGVSTASESILRICHDFIGGGA